LADQEHLSYGVANGLAGSCPSAGISREPANDRQYRMRGHLFVEFPDAN
jgi:hypothetical protein